MLSGPVVEKLDVGALARKAWFFVDFFVSLICS